MLKLACLFLVIATVIPSVAHALELPGKLRLAREQYLAVQPIYYPGFTAIGAAQPLSVLALAVLLALPPSGTPIFWLIAAALSATALTHVFYWTLTAPVNKVWLQKRSGFRQCRAVLRSRREHRRDRLDSPSRSLGTVPSVPGGSFGHCAGVVGGRIGDLGSRRIRQIVFRIALWQSGRDRPASGWMQTPNSPEAVVDGRARFRT